MIEIPDELRPQLEGVDLDELARLFARRHEKAVKIDPARIQPLPREMDDDLGEADLRRLEHAMVGEEAYKAGQVAFLVVAGGQGTRLGFDHAKGLYPVGPISKKSLFQLHAEKVLAIQRRFDKPFPLLVMTSPATDAETRQFFAQHNNFGLADCDVWLFCQGTMPAIDYETGKLLLEAPGKLFLSPNGHGGTLTGLADSGLLDRLENAGIDTVYYFQVDNPLVCLHDPFFVGQHLARGAEVSTKVLPKASASEKVGNVVLLDGRCAIIEYSDLDESLANLTNAHGKPVLWAANPAIHLFDVRFLRRVTKNADNMPWHLAHKKVPYLNERGDKVVPTENNAVKFERFIFDVLPLAERWTVFPTTREAEFAPLKNAEGADSPATVRAALIAQAAEWLATAGVDIPPGAVVEISPLFALDPEELARKVVRKMRIVGATYLQ